MDDVKTVTLSSGDKKEINIKRYAKADDISKILKQEETYIKKICDKIIASNLLNTTDNRCEGNCFELLVRSMVGLL